MNFAASTRMEFDGLTDHDVFTLALVTAARGYRIHGLLFVDTIKNKVNPDAFKKSHRFLPDLERFRSLFPSICFHHPIRVSKATFDSVCNGQ